ncbi:MAG TPA: ferrous iron transport protein B [Gammaproteobacteria bacterium]|nr:ferrous iron transport protein B [Gammaproteobacteria bacterium]
MPDKTRTIWTHRIDTFVLNRFLGIPLFFICMYVVFSAAIQVSDVLKGYFEVAAGILFIDRVNEGLIYLQSPDWLIRLLAFGVGQGLKTTISFMPVIAVMLFAISFLEASGYMARAAFVMERVMRWVGLPGKSVVPMVIGFGCNVPAVMAARTLENYRERVLTILMSPFMSCGARLTIYALFVSAFFPENGQNIIFGLYLIGIAVALITGFALRSSVLKGEGSSLVIELPSYRWPRIGALCFATWRRLKHFILKAGSLIVPLCAAIALLGVVEDKVGTNHFLASVGRTLTPIFAPMGIKEDNWPATVGLMTGVLAKEVVVGTLNTLYATEEAHSENLGSREGVALGVMVNRFGSSAAAFSYLLFVLLYFPCVSVVATMARELNRSWALFSVVWTTGIAYITAVLFYQCATFLENPRVATAWISGMCGVLAVAFYGVRKRMRYKMNKTLKRFPTQIMMINE